MAKTNSSAKSGIDLKGNKAGYATRDRKTGDVTYFKRAKDAPGYSDEGRTTAPASAGNAMYTKNAAGSVITPASLAPVGVVKPPVAPIVPSPDMGALNASVTGGTTGITTDAKGQLVVAPPVAPPATDDKYAGLRSIFDDYQQQKEGIAPPSNEKIYNKLYRETQIADKQQAVNDYSSQINTIVANRDANILRVEGQGRGIPEAIIGGQQAQLNKEAAIAALPVQAQLAAAQGNLQMAQSHLETMFKLRSADATAQYNHRTSALDSIYNFATKIEQSKIEDIKLSESKKYAEKQEFNKAQNAALQNALGQGAPASVYNAIKNATDLSGVTIAAGIYNGDVLGRQLQQAQLASANRANRLSEGDEVPTVKTINGVDMQWNPRTGTWDAIGSGGVTGAGGQSLENLNSKYTELLTDIGDATKLANTGAVGAGWAERAIKGVFGSNSNFNQVENIADTIKANLLTLNTDPAIKKFFGPQMSNRDTELMTGAASTLNPNKQTAEQFKRDLKDSAGVIARAREAVRQGMNVPVTTFTRNPNALAPSLADRLMAGNTLYAPDGMEIEIID